MSAGTEVYTNAPERWHITVFHTSQFDDTRPRPLQPLTLDVQQQDPAQRPLPTSAHLQQEQETVQMAVSKSQPLLLRVKPHGAHTFCPGTEKKSMQDCLPTTDQD